MWNAHTITQVTSPWGNGVQSPSLMHASINPFIIWNCNSLSPVRQQAIVNDDILPIRQTVVKLRSKYVIPSFWVTCIWKCHRNHRPFCFRLSVSTITLCPWHLSVFGHFLCNKIFLSFYIFVLSHFLSWIVCALFKQSVSIWSHGFILSSSWYQTNWIVTQGFYQWYNVYLINTFRFMFYQSV